MNDVLIYALIGLLCFTVFIIMNPHFLHSKTNKNKTPFMAKRFARHPNGLVSTIDEDYVDVNNKHWWKFSEWDLEVQANVPEDVIIEQGAEYGNGFYIFRVNRDGSLTEWNNPSYRAYFDSQAEITKQTEAQNKTELKKLVTKEDKFLTGNAEESKRVDAKYQDAQIKKLELEGMMALLKLRRGKGMGQSFGKETKGEGESGELGEQ